MASRTSRFRGEEMSGDEKAGAISIRYSSKDRRGEENPCSGGGKLGVSRSRRGGARQRTGSREGVRVGAARAGLRRRQRGALLPREGIPPPQESVWLRWRRGMRKAFECESLAQGHPRRAGRAGLNVTLHQGGQNGPLGLASVPQTGTLTPLEKAGLNTSSMAWG